MLPRATAMPVGTGSQPTVPGLACTPGRRHAGIFTVGGAKKVDTLPDLRPTRSTSLAPPSATSNPYLLTLTLNGLDSASTGLPLTNCTCRSGLCASSYFSRFARTLSCDPSDRAFRTDVGANRPGVGTPSSFGPLSATYRLPRREPTPAGAGRLRTRARLLPVRVLTRVTSPDTFSATSRLRALLTCSPNGPSSPVVMVRTRCGAGAATAGVAVATTAPAPSAATAHTAIRRILAP